MTGGITKAALAREGVELLDRGILHLRCSCCKHEWKIAQGADIRRPKHFRRCRVCNPDVNRLLERRHGRPARTFNTPFLALRQLRAVAVDHRRSLSNAA